MSGCARPLLENRLAALRPAESPSLEDDLAFSDLASALEQQAAQLESARPGETLIFGERSISTVDYAIALRKLTLALKVNSASFISTLKQDFDFLEVYGRDKWGEAFITSYFEPEISGSKKPDDFRTQALYRKPLDMLALDLSAFDEKFANERQRRARIDSGKLLPYFTREEIDSKAALSGRNLEICWVDPVDAFFLHVQGSGIVTFDDGSETKLNYADKNGQPYRPLGPALRERMPDANLTADFIEGYLRSLTPEDRQSLMNQNPSYVFFIESEKNAVTSSGLPATAGRTIAADGKFFPKGALAFLEFDKPVKLSTDRDVPTGTVRASRFVLDQDSGGAITGGGRVDLFWGRGSEAKSFAGRVKSEGRLWYIVPKSK